jgi:RNA polymerase sigma-B factor
MTTAIPARKRTQAEEAEAYRQLRQTNDPRLRDELIERALPLAHDIARRYVRSGESFDDLLQVARLGLVKAVDRFDPERNLAFSTYAVPTMVGEIKRYFRDTRWALRVPRSLQERVLEVEKTEKVLSARLNRAPTVTELAAQLELEEEEVLEAMAAASAFDTRSLDAPAPADDDQGRSYVETMGRSDDRFELVDDCDAVASAMRTLPVREQRIIDMRFFQDMTQSEIARRVGVSQMQISRILRRALADLRQRAESPPERVEIAA